MIEYIETELHSLNAKDLKLELDTYLFIFYENEADIDPSSVNNILKQIKTQCLLDNDYDKLEVVINYINILSDLSGETTDDGFLYADIDEVIEETEYIDGVEQKIEKTTLVGKILNIFKK